MYHVIIWKTLTSMSIMLECFMNSFEPVCAAASGFTRGDRGRCTPGDTMTDVTSVAVQIRFLISPQFSFLIKSSHNYSLDYSDLLTTIDPCIFHYQWNAFISKR